MVANNGSNGTISTINVRSDAVDEVADIEKAISITGYGAFNVLIFLAALPVAWSGIFDITSTAFIMASAECELQLTFVRKGVLAAIPFLGMLLTSFIWDHLTPYIGTRNLFILALLADSVLDILASAIDSYYAFLAIKFLNGVFAGGPFAMVPTYISEFHSTKYKASFARWGGLAINVAIIVPAVVAFLINPLTIVFNVFNRPYTAWRLYLLICSLVPVLGLVTACTLPHTPKYLLEIGKPEEAMKMLERMYSMNKRKSAVSFPVKALLVSKKEPLSQRPILNTISEKIRVAWYNSKLLFSSPYLGTIAFLNFLQFSSMVGFNTMRLWVPHMFIIMNNFDDDRWVEDRMPTMRDMLDRRMSVPARQYINCPNFDRICIQWKINASVYQNSAIIALSTVVVSFLAGFVTTSKFRKKAIMLAAFFVSVVSSFAMNWAYSPPYMLSMAAAIIVTTRITGNIVTAMSVDAIPIPLRSTSSSVLANVGHLAAILGNILFSVMMEMECLISFIIIGSLLLACFCLAFLPLKPVQSTRKSIV